MKSAPLPDWYVLDDLDPEVRDAVLLLLDLGFSAEDYAQAEALSAYRR